MGSIKPNKSARVFESEQASAIRRRLEQRAKTKAMRRALARRKVEDLQEERRLAHDLFDVLDGGVGLSLQ